MVVRNTKRIAGHTPSTALHWMEGTGRMDDTDRWMDGWMGRWACVALDGGVKQSTHLQQTKVLTA